jgi:glycogen(starch) synthase
VLRLCSVFEPPASALQGRWARFDPIGGMQEHTASLTRVLDARGVVQSVLTTRPPTAPWIERLGTRAIVVRVGLPVRRPRQLYAIPAAMLAPLLSRNADLVHVHLGEDLAILPLAALAARARRLPIVLTVHCSPSHTLAVHDARSLLLRTLGGWVERRGEARAAATIVYTRRLAEVLENEQGCQSVHVMRRGIDSSAFTDVRAGRDRTAGPRRVVFVGRVVRGKGVLTLVKAFSRLRTPGIELVFVGDGPARIEVERLARRLGVADRIQVTGFVPHARVPALLGSADLLVLPSLYEELGTVLIEALHAGLPVVASRVGGIPEVVEDGVTGLLVPPSDADALARAIDTVLGDAELAARMGAGALQRARGYELEQVAAEVHALYARLAEQRSALPAAPAVDGRGSPARALGLRALVRSIPVGRLAHGAVVLEGGAEGAPEGGQR